MQETSSTAGLKLLQYKHKVITVTITNLSIPLLRLLAFKFVPSREEKPSIP